MRCSPRGTLPNIACNTRPPRITKSQPRGKRTTHFLCLHQDQESGPVQFLGWASSELTVPRPITAPRWMQPTLDPSRREASSRVVCSSMYRDVGCWEVRQLWTGARRKCFQNTSIHSMNLRIKVQQRRAEQQTSIGDCWLTQLQRNQHFVYGTRTMHTVISSVKPGSAVDTVSLSQLVFSSCYFLK